MKLKWAFGFPAGVSANAQPTVVSGRVFVGSDNGFFYSLDAKTGCVYWSFESGSIVPQLARRSARSPARAPARYAVFFGDGHANVYALDAQTGAMLWKTKVDPHFVARITAGTKLLQRQAVRAGLVVRGIQQRQSRLPVLHVARQRRRARCEHRQRDLESLGHPRGAEAVQDDGERRRALQARGRRGVEFADRRSGPQRGLLRHRRRDDGARRRRRPTRIMAVDINTGKLLWSYQATENDVFMGGCNGPQKSEACPTPLGPDMDIGNSPILMTLPTASAC